MAVGLEVGTTVHWIRPKNFLYNVTSLVAGNEPAGVIFEDFNHDGRIDLAAANYDDPSNFVDRRVYARKREIQVAQQIRLVKFEQGVRHKGLGSELASHIVEYGTWLKGLPHWSTNVHIGQKTIDEKRRRIGAFMKSLPCSWLRLDDVFRAKYSVKLRRETQRLLLLERGAPVPATRILDDSWCSISRSPYEVHDRLNQLASQSSKAFIEDLFGRIENHFRIARGH